MYESYAKSSPYPSPMTSGTAYTTAPAPVAPDMSASVIRDGLCYAEQLLSEMHDAISHLEKRLETALTPLPPANAATQGIPTGPPASHVAGRLVILNDGTQSAIARLRELAQRVEV